ncbi:GntR family transcriptional regulator [Sphaerisporangium sp. NPDC051011]|uniref:GntR family transcriptional regulator n=1 Tax=Sphaerisporangium sp. NPDC051011 TaxID=3155792 RepID=UPI0033DC2847
MDHDRPTYLRIADRLRAEIVSGVFAPGARLPSIPELIKAEGVSDVTARRAMRVLVSEGLVTAQPGRGTFVRERPPIRRLVRSWYREMRGGSPFAADLASQGKTGTWDYVTSTVQAPAEIRERLSLDAPQRDEPDAVRTEYVFRADGEPVMLSTSWEPYILTRGTPVVFPEDGPHEGAGVVERMRLIDVLITHAVEVLRPRPAENKEAERLGIQAGDIVQAIERTYWADDRPVETADIVIPGELYQVVYALPVREE